jgi:hypothetical protein
MLGNADTDSAGKFEITFTKAHFTEFIFDHNPDVFFRIYRAGKLLDETDPRTLGDPGGRLDVEIEVDPSDDGGRPGYPPRDQFEPQPEPDPVNTGRPRDLPDDDRWKGVIQDWIAERNTNRSDPEWEARKERMPRPWLDCTSNFGPQIVNLHLNEPGEVQFTVWNDGSIAAFTCYVELYEGPGGYASPLSDYHLRGRKIITLQPGEKRDVSLPWVRRQTSGRIVGIVYDPLLDPIDFVNVEQYNRHITSVHWSYLE